MAAPVVLYLAPAAATPIEVDGFVQWDVYENGTALVRTIAAFDFSGMALTEVVWDGAAFSQKYARLATRTAVVDGTYGNGHRYRVRRDPLWPDAPALRVWAVNTAGLEVNHTSAPWPLIAPAVPAYPDAVPVFPAASGPGPTESDAVAHDETYFLTLFERIMAPGWLAPLKENEAQGSGYELLRAFARVGARMSTAFANLETGAQEIFAAGPSKALGVVEFSRPDATAGAVRVLAGTLVATSKGGRTYRTLTDAVFGGSDVGPVGVAAEAIDYGWQYNVKGRVITPSAITLPGEIDTIVSMRQADAAGVADFIDATFTVAQILDFAGGAAPMLDGLGEDRGVYRGPGESDETYRHRILSLPDTVSPGAFRRFLDGVFDYYELTYDFVETWQRDYQTCFDYPSDQVGTPTYLAGPLPANLVADKDLFVYDWPLLGALSVPISNRWLDSVEMRGAVIIGVPNLPALSDVGMAYDDTAVTVADRTTQVGQVLGSRGTGAFDVPYQLPEYLGLQGGYDGFDLQKQGFYLSLLANLNAIKAAGVAVLLELRGE
mgnify:CR=1 FL=1